MEGLEHILAQHPFFTGFCAEHSRLVAGCARNHRYDAGEYLFREGGPADEFFLYPPRASGHWRSSRPDARRS